MYSQTPRFMSTARKILSNTIAQIIGKFIITILGLAVVKISTNYLSVEGYGEYVLIYEFLAFFGIAADLGLFTIGIKEMSEDESKIPVIIGNILSLRTALVTFTMLLAIAAAFLMPAYANTHIPLGVLIASLTVFLTIINGTISSVLQTKLQMHLASLATVIGKIISVAFMFYVVFYGFPDDAKTGFYMLIFAGIVGNLFMVLATHYYVRKITPLVYRFDFALWKKVLKTALPYGIALILNTIYFRMNAIFLSFMRGPQEVGIYGVAMKMLEHFSIIPLYFMNSVLPVLTKALKEKSEKYRDIIRYAFDFLLSISVPMVVGGVMLAYPIIFIISTPEFLSRLSEGFYGSDIAFQILIFASLFQFLNVLFAFVLVAVGKQAKLLYISGSAVVFNIIANLIFIPIYGFRAAAVVSVLCELIILVANYFTAKKYLDFSINLKNTAKIFLSAFVMGAAIYFLQPITYKFLQNWNVLLLIAIGMVIYTFMLFASGVVDKNLLNLLRKKAPEKIPETIA